MSLFAADACKWYVSPFSGHESRVICVGKSVTSNFRQISDAIRFSRPYDRIEVESGKYFESLTIQHPLELCNTKDGEPPVIVSRGPCLKIKTSGPVLVQSLIFSAKGTKPSDSQGILVEEGNPLIQDCEISSVYVMNDASPRISHCHICNSDYGYGLYITGKSGGVYENNDISFHNEQCVYINTSGKPELRQNRISQKEGQKNVAVLISGRLHGTCEPILHENIVQGGREAVNQGEMDPASNYAPQMLYSDNSGEWACLVGVMYGASPRLTRNLLCNGVAGFFFRKCKISRNCFSDNRVTNCASWGLVVGEKVSLIAMNIDIQKCGGGVFVTSGASSSSAAATDATSNNGGNHISNNEIISHSIVFQKCELLRNFHYGFLIDRGAVHIANCRVSESSVGIAFLGNCLSSIIKKNTLEENSVAGFSVLRQGAVLLEENVVQGGRKGMYGLFVQEGSTVTLRTTLINRVSTGIFLQGESSLVAEKNVLSEASVHHVTLTNHSNALLQENTMERSNYAAVVVTSFSECKAFENVMYTSSREGVLVEDRGNVVFEKNSMSSFREAIYVKNGGSMRAEGNDITLTHHGVVVEGKESNCAVINNNFKGLQEITVHALDQATVTINGNSMIDFRDVCIQIGTGASALVEKNMFSNGHDGVVHADGRGTQCKVLCCRMENVSYGVKFTNGSSGIIENNEMYDCSDFGISCHSGNSVVVKNNVISDAKNGMQLLSDGDIYDNVIKRSHVGIVACPSSTAHVRDHQIIECGVGLYLMKDTRVHVSSIRIAKSKEFGVVVTGPSKGVTISHITVEDSEVAGVLVQLGGMCRFEQCIIRRSKEDGIRLEQAGAVVFEQCMVTEQRRGVKVTGGLGNESAADAPQLVHCRLDGNWCEEGVFAAKKGVVCLELCKISARCPQEGRGVVLHDGGVVFLSHCDVNMCPSVGLAASPKSHLKAEHSTVDNCGVGVCFTSEQEETSLKPDRKQSNKSTTTADNNNNNNNNDGGNNCGTTGPAAITTTIPTTTTTGDNGAVVRDSAIAAQPPTISHVTITGCTEAGICFEPFSLGVVNSTTVVKCLKGIVFQNGSHVTLESTVVRESTNCGMLFRGWPVRDSVLAQLTISDSGDCGIRVEKIVSDSKKKEEEEQQHQQHEENKNEDNEENEEDKQVEEQEKEKEEKTLLKIQKSEVLRNAKGGAVLEMRLLFVECTFAHNAVAGVMCREASRPVLTGCHFVHNEETNVDAEVGSTPELRDCVLEDSPMGVRVHSAVHMTRCIAKHLGVAVNFMISGGNSSAVAKLSNCVFSENETGVSCAGGDVCGGAASEILMEGCVFHDNTERSVLVNKGPKVVLKTCCFESSREGVTVTEEGIVNIETCSFQRNSKGITSSNVNSLEVKASTFTAQTQHAINVTGTNQETYITGNSFIRNTPRGIFIFAESSVVLVNDNYFEDDVCGIFIQETPHAFVYNNHFQTCRTGILCHGEGFCGNIFGNNLKENQCGCRCEESATTYLWRNTFEANTEYGILSTSRANPIIADNSFVNHTTPISFALCVENGGMGHISFNRYIKNACGIQLEDSGGTVVVNNSVFDGNDVAMQLKDGASVHVVACSFVSSTSCDIFASGSIGEGQCVLAYNCFSGKRGVAVTVEKDAAVIVYRCIFLGSYGTGFVQGPHGKGLALESLFYEIASGIRVDERGEGGINNCFFVRCGTAVEVCRFASTHFNSCNFLARPTNAPVLVSVHDFSTPTFQECSFIGWSEMHHPLLQSSGGGLLEDSLFVAGEIAVVLEDNCQMVLRQNTFLRGGVGVRCNPRSQGKVLRNTFLRHKVAAVNIMDNAAGELEANVFAQPLESGGILAGLHKATIGPQAAAGGPPARGVKAMTDGRTLESDFIAAFAEFVSSAPQWVRDGMNETPQVTSSLPLPILAAMSEPPEKDNNINDGGRGGGEEEEGENVKKDRSKSVTTKVAAVAEDTDIPGRKKALQKEKHAGGSTKAKKTGKIKKKRVETFTFPLSEDIVRVPRDVQETLQNWVEAHEIALNVEKAKGFDVTQEVEQTRYGDLLRDMSERMTALEEAKNVEKRGNFGDDKNKNDEIRGVVMELQCLTDNDDDDDDKTGSVKTKEKVVRDVKPVDPRKSAVERHQVYVRPSITTKFALCSRLPIKADGLKESHVKKKSKRKLRRLLPPPLNSCSREAQPTHQMSRGKAATLAGSLIECGVKHYRKPKVKDTCENSLLIDSPLKELVTLREVSEHEQPSGDKSVANTINRSETSVGSPSRSARETTSRISASPSMRSTLAERLASGQTTRSQSQSLARFDDAASSEGRMWRDNVTPASSRSHSKGASDKMSSSNAKELFGSTGSERHKSDSMEIKKVSSREEYPHAERGRNQYSNSDYGNDDAVGSDGISGMIPQNLTADERARSKRKAAKVLLSEAFNADFDDDRDKLSGVVGGGAEQSFDGGHAHLNAASPHDGGGISKDSENAEARGLMATTTTKKNKKGLMKGSQNAHQKGKKSKTAPASSVAAASDCMKDALNTSESQASKNESRRGSAGGKLSPFGKKKRFGEVDDTKLDAASSAEVALVSHGGQGGKGSKGQMNSTQSGGKGMKHPHNRSGTATLQEGRVRESSPHPQGNSFSTMSASGNSSVGSSPGFLQGDARKKRVSERLHSGSFNSTVSIPPEYRPNTAIMLSSETRVGGDHISGQKEEQDARSKNSNDMHFPKITVSSVVGSLTGSTTSYVNLLTAFANNNHNIAVKDDSGKTTVPSLSEKGHAVIDILGATVLQGDTLQEHVRAASSGPRRKKKILRKGSLTGEVLSVSGVIEEGKTRDATEKWEEDEDRGEEEEEEVEDIVAILRWLVQLREQRLLNNQRFNMAVECVRSNTKVPFFISEGTAAGGSPMLMVRLPRTADEAVSVPLFGTVTEMREEVEQIADDKGDNRNGLQPQRGKFGILEGSPEARTGIARRTLPSLGREGDVDERKHAGKLETNNAILPTSHHADKPQIFFARTKYPRGHFNASKEVPTALGNAMKSLMNSDSPLGTIDALTISDSRPPTGVADSIRETLNESSKDHNLSLHVATRKPHHSSMPHFNPAMPKETSPYNRSARVAAFIAVGTTNFMA